MMQKEGGWRKGGGGRGEGIGQRTTVDSVEAVWETREGKLLSPAFVYYYVAQIYYFSVFESLYSKCQERDWCSLSKAYIT